MGSHEPAPRQPDSGSRYWLLLVALVSIGLFSPSLGYGFVEEWDDDWLVLSNPYLADPGWTELAAAVDPTISLQPWGYEYLPLRNLSLLLDRAVWGFQPFGYHLTNLLLHGLASLLFYLLLVRTGPPPAAAAAGALIFAVHPLHVEPVVWVMGRRTCLALAFTTLAGWHWMGPEQRTWRAGVVPALCLAAAAFSKATALALPALFVALDLASPRRSVRSGWRPYLPVVMTLAVVTGIHLWTGYRSRLIGGIPYGTGAVQRAAVVGAFFFHYARLAVWPVDIVIPYPWSRRFLPVKGPTDATAAAGLLLAALMLAAIIHRARRDREQPDLLLAALIWWPAALLPAINLLVPIQRAFAARYAALASLALGLAAAGVAAAGRKRAIGVGLAVVALGTISAIRIPDWRDSRRLWQSGVERAPGNRMVWYKLGHSYDVAWRKSRDPRELEQAERCYRKAIALDANHRNALHDLGVLLEHQGRPADAMRLYQRALPKPLACFNLARLELKQGRVERARALLRQALAGRPSLTDARTLLDKLEHK